MLAGRQGCGRGETMPRPVISSGDSPARRCSCCALAFTPLARSSQRGASTDHGSWNSARNITVPERCMSASRSDSRSACQRASTYSGLSTGNRSVARMRVLNGRSTLASRRPLPPKPTIPTVLRCRSRVERRVKSRHCWARKNAGRLRHHAVTRAIVCSATWSASTPDALVTMISESITEGTRQ